MEESLALVAKLRTGDKTVVTKLIEHNIRLAMTIVSYYGRRSQVEDIVSIALLELTMAVERAAKSLVDDNIGPYLTVSISRAINKFLAEDRLISIPVETKRIKGLPDIKVSSINNKLHMDDKDDSFADARKVHFDAALVAPDSKGTDKIWERLFEITKTDLEREIILLKSQGYTNNEVAALLDEQPSKISRIKSELERRYYDGE